MVICSVACPFHINSACAHIRCFRVRARLVPTMFRRVIRPTSKKNLSTHSRRRAQRSSASDTCPMPLKFSSVTNYFDSARFFPTSVVDTYVIVGSTRRKSNFINTNRTISIPYARVSSVYSFTNLLRNC